MKNNIEEHCIHKLILEQLYTEFSDQDFLMKISIKYPQLSESDIIICGLISLRKSNSEIAIIVEKTENCIRFIIHRIVYRLNLTCRRELFHKLIAINDSHI